MRENRIYQHVCLYLRSFNINLIRVDTYYPKRDTLIHIDIKRVFFKMAKILKIILIYSYVFIQVFIEYYYHMLHCEITEKGKEIEISKIIMSDQFDKRGDINCSGSM